MPATLVIPAHNEASRITSVIEAAFDTNSVEHIVVVDDGSSDYTFEVASELGVTVLQHATNEGKGQALQTGYERAKELGASTLLFLDADLRGLTPEHIDSLVVPVVKEEAIMTIGILERTALQKAILKRWGALSGQRALPISLWEQLGVKEQRGFRVEAGLNILTRRLGVHHDILRPELSGVTHVGKREKEPTLLRAGLASAPHSLLNCEGTRTV